MSYPPAPSSHHQHHPAPHGWAHHPVASTSTSYASYDPPHEPMRFAFTRDADPRPALADPYSHQPQQQRDHQPASASTLTPPSSFGGFGFRRARSSGALPTLQPAALHEQSLHPYAPFPPSPVSPNYPHGDASAGQQQQQQQQRPASALSSWRAQPADPSGRDGWAPGPSSYGHESAYSSSSSGPWAQQPQTPPPSARFRRTSSAQPSFAAAPSSAASTPSRPGSAYSARAPTSHGVHETASAMGYSSTKFQHSSPEEINQFLNDMSEILGPDALAALSPTSSAPPPRPFDPRQAPSVNVQPPQPAKKQATYNVAGVLLDEDEYRAYAESPTSSRQPSPVRASSYDDRPQQSRPPFGGSAYREPAYAAPSYEAWSGGYLAPSQVDIQRPASAPPTPVLDLEASSSWTQFAPYGSTYQSPVMRSTAAMNRRRGSSFDASSIPRIYSSGLVGLQPLAEDAYSRFNAGLGFDESVQAFEQQPQRRTPPASTYPPSFRTAPTAFAPSPPPPQQQQHSSTPSPVSPQRPPRQQQPQQQPREQPQRPPQPEPTTPVRRPKAKTSISFLNFSAADSKQLLGGVAPSGSSKKRARDDDHSPAQKKEKRAA